MSTQKRPKNNPILTQKRPNFDPKTTQLNIINHFISNKTTYNRIYKIMR